MKLSLSLFACLGLAGALAAQTSSSEAVATAVVEPADALLEQAYAIASAMPLRPHIKNRSRAQERVVVTCLELEKPLLAKRYADGIENWRRAAAYADLARYYAERGQNELAQPLAAQAQRMAETNELGAEGWRQERILAKVAEAQFELGQQEVARQLAGQLEVSEQPTLSSETLDEEGVTAFLQSLPGLAQTGQLETMLQALDACVPLFEQHYAKQPLRERIYKDMRNAWNRVPGLERVRLARSLAEVCLEQGDAPRAQSLLGDIRVLMDSMRWEPRYQVPAQAQLANLRAQAGQRELARAELEGAMELYQTRREEVINIYRAETLLPVAEGFLALGDRENAAQVYAQAVEESVVNPNSRPRAVDLTDILCSMASTGFVPGEALQARIDEIQKGLGDPW